METNAVVKSKPSKAGAAKKGPVSEVDAYIAEAKEKYGINLTLDNSLKRFANDPAIVAFNEMVERKLSGKKKND